MYVYTNECFLPCCHLPDGTSFILFTFVIMSSHVGVKSKSGVKSMCSVEVKLICVVEEDMSEVSHVYFQSNK